MPTYAPRQWGGSGASTGAVIEDLSLLAEPGVAMCSPWMPIDGARPADALAWFAARCAPGSAARHAMPLAGSFLLIGAFLWLAENGATFLGAWQYPDQGEVWRMVHLSTFGSWALLVSVSFVLVAALKRGQSRAFPHRAPAPAPPAGILPPRFARATAGGRIPYRVGVLPDQGFDT